MGRRRGPRLLCFAVCLASSKHFFPFPSLSDEFASGFYLQAMTLNPRYQVVAAPPTQRLPTLAWPRSQRSSTTSPSSSTSSCGTSCVPLALCLHSCCFCFIEQQKERDDRERERRGERRERGTGSCVWRRVERSPRLWEFLNCCMLNNCYCWLLHLASWSERGREGEQKRDEGVVCAIVRSS